MIPVRCKCGRWTTAGLTCVACSRDQFVFSSDSDEEEIDEELEGEASKEDKRTEEEQEEVELQEVLEEVEEEE